MAISKILYMKDCGETFHGKHLSHAISYITDAGKTQGGRLIDGVNCIPALAFEQMKDTKRKYGKPDKRQGYHLIISFKENEVTPDTAMELTSRFVKEYLGSEYEAVYAVHDNTRHIHAHIVFNSVSFLTGKKYRYEKGDWAREIQPITNRLCQEYGLSTIEIEDDKLNQDVEYRETRKEQAIQHVWNSAIRRELDACIILSATYEEFQQKLTERGYECKEGKYLAIRPPGMKRFRRTQRLGEDYTIERIQERIETETLRSAAKAGLGHAPRIVGGSVRRHQRAKLTGLQKRYFARLYRTGKLKRRPYSQAWRYRDDIRKMKKLQNQYLFLAREDITTVPELQNAVQALTARQKEAAREKSRLGKQKHRFQELFELAAKMEELEAAFHSYERGDSFFTEEHQDYEVCQKALVEKGYTYEEICAVRERITREYAEATSRERQLYRELKTGKGLLKEMETEDKTQRQTKGEIDGTERREEQETQRQGDRGVSAENEKITL